MADAAGNVAPAQVTVLGVPVPGITNVSNPGPGLDGADEEPIEDTLRRAPEELKIRDRAVTADDYEFLAREASNDVRIVRCLTPRLQAAVAPGPAPAAWQKGDPWTFAGIVRAPGNVNLIIVPSKETAVLSIVTVPELTFVLTGIGSATFAFVETLLALCVCYLALVELTSRAGMWAEARIARFMA